MINLKSNHPNINVTSLKSCILTLGTKVSFSSKVWEQKKKTFKSLWTKIKPNTKFQDQNKILISVKMTCVENC